MSLQINHQFDDDTYRHTINGHQFVLHCHHYMCLTSKLAEDFADIGGVRALVEATEDSFRPVFDSYFNEKSVSDPNERLNLGAEYYTFMGLGVMKVSGTAEVGEAKLAHSHVDEGWIQKFGTNDKPINHMTCGYVAALFAAAFNKPARSYNVTETSSIVTGASESVLAVGAA